jgi:hypothetical protein
MFLCVAERSDCAGYFPEGGNRAALDYVGDLSAAQVFRVSVSAGKLVSKPELPAHSCWKIRPVEVRLK